MSDVLPLQWVLSPITGGQGMEDRVFGGKVLVDAKSEERDEISCRYLDGIVRVLIEGYRRT